MTFRIIVSNSIVLEYKHTRNNVNYRLYQFNRLIEENSTKCGTILKIRKNLNI
jgi:hypothetical protein